MPAAQYYLGDMYRSGEGVAQDDVEAVKWYRRAGGSGRVEAQSCLGFMYFYGKGVCAE